VVSVVLWDDLYFPIFLCPEKLSVSEDFAALEEAFLSPAWQRRCLPAELQRGLAPPVSGTNESGGGRTVFLCCDC